MVFAAIGIYLIASTLPGAVATLLRVWFAGEWYRGPTWQQSWPDLLAQALTCVLGAALVLGGGKIRDLFKQKPATTENKQ